MKDCRELLSICIPVYNNLKSLKRNVELLYELFKYNEILPLNIYISDNASEDGLDKEIANLINLYPTIIYQRNENNIGLDGNIEKVLKMATTKYAWLLGVDDSIKGDIRYIIEILEERKPDFLVLKDYNGYETGEYTNPRQIFTKFAYESNWISTDIFNTELVSQLNFEKYRGTYWGHTFAILDYLQKGELKYYLADNRGQVFHLDGNNTSWSSNFIDIMCFKWIDGIMSIDGFTYQDKIDAIKCGRLYDRMSNMWLLSLRAKGLIDLNFVNKNYNYICLYNNSPKIIIKLISICPSKLLAILRNVYIKISKVN